MIGRRAAKAPYPTQTCVCAGTPVRRRAPARGGWILFACALFLPTAAAAQSGQWNAQEVLANRQWVAPPDPIAQAVLAPRYLNATLSAISRDRKWFVHEVGDGPVTMDRFSKPFDELGGQFIDFRANRSRALTIRSNIGIEVISAADGSKVSVQIPRGARVSNATWSPDGTQLAFFAHADDATHIYVADPATGRFRQITRTPVLGTMVTSFEWTGGGREIATVLPPEGRAPRPTAPVVPTGPQVKMTEDGENNLRTYASLMKAPHDEALLEWHATGQLAVIDVTSGRVVRVGRPVMIWSFDFAPSGEFVRVTKLDKPFSYIVPVSNFGRSEEIWDRSGNVLAELEKTPMNTGLRQGGGGGGGGDDDDEDQLRRRQVAWREDGRGLTYLEQEPAPAGESPTAREPSPAAGGQEAERPRRKDRVMQWLPPFDSSGATILYESDNRITTHRYSPNHDILFLSERQGDNVHEYAVYLDSPGTRHTLARYDSEDFYANPGRLVLAGGNVPAGGGFGGGGGGGGAGAERGGEVAQLSADGQHAFFYGTQYDKDPLVSSPKSFLDRVAIRSGEKQRIYESSNDGVWERITAIVDIDASAFVVSRESSTQVPQSYRRSPGAGASQQLTNNQDYTPDLTAAPRERFVVERPDGFRFMVNVMLPPGHSGGRLPAMFWFYPREYEDQEGYDETGRTYNKNAFPNFGTRSMQYLARLGYAVVEPDAPIVGKPGQMNNNYEHDLRNNLAAVIDELDRREIIDRRRLGLGGHSYGAFSTLNAMVHTPFFKAGIAGDGNYNRTLTPLSFQSERRNLWDAKDTYLSMSPFLYANNLTGAVLLYHGLGDQNVGTDPINSPRLFHALNGLDKDAVMYLYPFEDHGPATKETLLDLWARWTAWLEVHLGTTGGRIISER